MVGTQQNNLSGIDRFCGINNLYMEVMEFSKIQLGTVQFGIDYGIANTKGKVSYETARDIIATAFDGGVNTLDTAATYGNSEDILGRALTELNLQDKVQIISKVPSVSGKNLSFADAEKFITESVEISLRQLKRDYLHVCLFHNEEDIKYINVLQQLESRGLIKGYGVSLNSTEYCEAVLSSEIKFVQLAYNILDKRYDSFFGKASSKGIKIFTRSIYLQGLLLMPEEKIKPFLKDVIPVRRRLEALATFAGMEMLELCVRFVLSNCAVTSILVGVDNLDQLEENISFLTEKGPLPDNIMREIKESVPILPEEIIMPANWEKYRN